MIPLTLVTEETICSMLVPALFAMSAPACTRSTDSLIRSAISFAALALRCASARTSPATTAKPRPCSPARAASTAAFNARILVWKEIPLITLMISLIFFELSVMDPIVLTTSQTILPPERACSAATTASLLASRAFSALRFTVEVSSSILAAVSTTAAACSSVREARSIFPTEISEEALAT